MANTNLNKEDIQKEFEKLKTTQVNDKKINDTIKEKEYVEKISKKGPLSKYCEDIKDFFGILKNNNKNGFSVSAGSIAVIVGALLYIVSPIDLIPDAIPILGFVDDAAIISAAVASLAKELKEYREKKDKFIEEDK